MSLVAISIAGLVLLSALLISSTRMLQRTQQTWTLFDGADTSPLYCQEDLLSLLRVGPTPVSHGLSFSGDTRLCLPQRIDYAAPGSHRDQQPAAICAILAAAQLPASLARGEHGEVESCD